MNEPEHVCRPGAAVYYCPTSGSIESDCHGGFDVCCDRPDLHQPLVLTGDRELDSRRRYLVPVGWLQLPDEPRVVHLALYSWNERLGDWLIGLALCGRSVEGEALLDGTVASCPNCPMHLRTYEEALAREVAALLGSEKSRAARAEAGDTVENGAWHTVWLEGNWSWVTQKMTTEQREYAADRVAAYSAYLAAVDGELERTEPEGLRWWREAGR